MIVDEPRYQDGYRVAPGPDELRAGVARRGRACRSRRPFSAAFHRVVASSRSGFVCMEGIQICLGDLGSPHSP
jgi:hypothetical protein